MDLQKTKKYAQLAIDLEFVPILLRPNSKIPLRPGFLETTLEDAQKTFDNINRGHNIGILTGKASHIIVLDIEKDDLPKWEQLLEEHGGLKETLTVRTGGGGIHVYFQLTSSTEIIRNGVKIKLPLGDGTYSRIDIRTTGGQVLWIGDVHPETGNLYLPISGFSEEEVILRPMPKWLSEMIIKAQSLIGRGSKR